MQTQQFSNLPRREGEQSPKEVQTELVSKGQPAPLKVPAGKESAPIEISKTSSLPASVEVQPPVSTYHEGRQSIKPVLKEEHIDSLSSFLGNVSEGEALPLEKFLIQIRP